MSIVNNNNVEVSVYCLCYNHAKYLRDALEGFVQQETSFSFEVIVHDDASTDGSREIIEEYAKKHPDKIKTILQKENQYSKSVDIVKEFIVPLMKGKYVAVCEGDDYWTDSHKLQIQYDFLEIHSEYVACVHNCERVDATSGEKDIMYDVDEDKDIDFYMASLGGGSYYQTASLFYRKEYLIEKPDFFREAKSFGDYPLAMYLTLAGKVRYLCDVMSVYRVNVPGSWTVKNNGNKKNKANILDQTIKLVNAVDEYTNHTYHEHLRKLNVQNEYDYYYYTGQYAKLRKQPYREIYKKKTIDYRLKTYAKQLLRR